VYYGGSSAIINNEPESLYDIFNPPNGYTGPLPAGPLLLPSSAGWFSNVPTVQNAAFLEEKITAQLGSGVLHLAALQNRSYASNSFNQNTSVVAPLYGGIYLNGSSTPTIFDGTYHTITLPGYGVNETFGSNNRDYLLSYAMPLGENFHAGISFVKSYYDIPGYYNQYSGSPLTPIV